MSAERLPTSEFLYGMRLIGQREWSAYFDLRIAHVYAAAFALLANAIFMNDFFLRGTADMGSYFERLPLLLAFFLPAVTMRLWAEERKHRTIELLLTMPVIPAQAVAGKYLAALGLYLLLLASSLPIVGMLIVLGEPDLGQIGASYFGAVLFGCEFLAFGMLISALTSDQIIAFVASTLLGYGFVLTGHDQVVSVLDGWFPAVLIGSGLRNTISVMPHYEAFTRGVIELSAVLHFVAMSILFLWLNAVALREGNRS